MDNVPANYWKIVLGVGILVTILSIIPLPTLYKNISGDSVPNRPQREPPIEYQWNTTISRVTTALISVTISFYSYRQLRRTNR